MTHICVGNLIIIGSDNGLSPGWHQTISWISPLGTNFNEILSEIDFHSRKSISKCRMENGSHFVQSSMCYVYGALGMLSTYFVQYDVSLILYMDDEIMDIYVICFLP